MSDPRPRLESDRVSPEAQQVVASFHRGFVDEVSAAVTRDPIVVIGMAQNPYCKKAREILDARGAKYTYLEYGSYFSRWKERLALKLWAGFPTFPMVFVNGTLVGGSSELQKLVDAGGLR